MVLRVLPWCFCLIYIISAQESTVKQLQLNVYQNEKCVPNVPELIVAEGNTINLTVAGQFDFLNWAECSSQRLKTRFLGKSEFHQPNKSQGNRTAYATLKSNKKHHGKWNCTFLVRRGQNWPGDKYLYKGENYTKIVCLADVTVTESDVPPIDQKTLYYIIGGVVAVVILIIIIAQTAIILHFKAKANAAKLAALPHLQRLSSNRDDSTRYSVMPGERKKSQKREASGIYQSLENLRTAAGIPPPSPSPNVKDRPPMPLPADDDEEHIYDDGETLQRIFTPVPPPVATLPKKDKKKGKPSAHTPKPASKPHQQAPGLIPMEDYDYPDIDTVELLKSQDMHHQKSNPVSIPPKPEKPKAGKPPKSTPAPIQPAQKPAPNTGGVLLNELKNNLLRKRMSNQVPTRPHTKESTQTMRPVPQPTTEMTNVRGKPLTKIRPQATHTEETNPQKLKPRINPENINPQKLVPQNLGRFQQNTAPQEVPNVRRPSEPTPQQPWTQRRDPHIPQETTAQKGWGQKPIPGMRPQDPSTATRSPPVSRVQPMVQKPATPAKPKPAFNPAKPPPPEPTPQDGFNHKKPPPPEPTPQAAFKTLKRPPAPEPIPQESELYEAVAPDYSDSDEEWQYEALPNYNIYSM
ncbi:basic proline-rich protein-like isoform X3 [Pectinophora gossypiella]|uniref:basic proline-rich protein-like isoform X3 n=1 Tax=Pectinophora gossypiella TaxID=13191 RepID=UPI00214E7AAB|nr:basic proline-rich protein-like isoform X3 [Pectinophora gossypiella]